ncbi:hypothetical protein CVIRNUC_006217 [Coccomyxa viridis]|uniref:Uncharacterized protein n=1 Tax=Coccomyxa viridis TaxID=1274662 RepID=A0AAV1I8I1_9CHLO|nr:hypothetical protein CVIRNUC_006217 [Coccomyxa viridis]
MSKDELENLRRRIVGAAASAHFDQAISDCRSAVEACTDDEDTSRLFTNMSLLYHQKEDWNKAIDMAERALQAWPGNVKACFRKGAAQMRLALPAAACVSFQRGLQFAPGHRHLQTALHQAQSQLREDFAPGIMRANGPQNCELASQDTHFEALDQLEQRTKVIKQLWQAGQVHQASLRGKGWYESCMQDEAHQAQFHPLCGDLEASNLHQILQIAQGSSFRELRFASVP